MLQVDSVKIGEKYINAIKFENIVSILRDSETLTIFGEPHDDESVFSIQLEVAHCEHVHIRGLY